MLQFLCMLNEATASQDDSQPRKLNLRRPDVMAAVQAKVMSHYRSELVERILTKGYMNGPICCGEIAKVGCIQIGQHQPPIKIVLVLFQFADDFGFSVFIFAREYFYNGFCVTGGGDERMGNGYGKMYRRYEPQTADGPQKSPTRTINTYDRKRQEDQSPEIEHGVVTFAVPLTNTPLNIPMTLSLKKEYLQRIPFFAAYAETNSAYIQLPLDIVKVGGTVGSPKAKLNLSAKDLFTTKNVTTILKGVESQVGGSKSKSIISDINGVLGGGQSNTATNTPATNSTPQSIVPAANKLLNGLFKK